MRTSDLSFLSPAKKLALAAYEGPKRDSPLLSEIIGRIAAAILLSPAAACEIVLHGLFVIPTIVYSIGKTIIFFRIDFTVPWQHIERVRNAVSPLFLGSLFGIIHPYAGLLMSEETDKHAFAGMISSNTYKGPTTPCSPVHSLAIVKDIANAHRFETIDGKTVELFTEEQVDAISEARSFEKSLESLQAQEFVQRISNLTLYVMAEIMMALDGSPEGEVTKAIIARVSVVLIPVLSVIDAAIAAIVQSVFLMTGVVRLISGRGPVYTEITTNPLMHVAFLVQNILKLVGNLLGSVVWIISPVAGFQVSLLPSLLFFKLQQKIVMLWIEMKMWWGNCDKRFALPIAYAEGERPPLSFPAHDGHKTYLIVERKSEKFNLYWVNRPNINCMKGLSLKEASTQIESMFNERFPFMDVEKMMNYPIRGNVPPFSGTHYDTIAEQGNYTNCVVSNLFGMIEALDIINGKDKKISTLRNKVVRQDLLDRYSHYKNDFHPWMAPQNWYAMTSMYHRGDTSHPI